jgi:cytochrome c peroxidase
MRHRVTPPMSIFLALVLLSGQPAAAELPIARPLKTAAERAAFIATLRTEYAGDPETWPAPHVDPDVEHRELGPLPPMPYPADNPPSAAKIKLGRQLFFDPRLSGSGQLACASCHDPDLGWGDGRATSFGHDRKQLTRNAPTILNTGYRETLFWDGRASSLEDQAHKVLTNQDEMHSSGVIVVDKILAIPGYLDQFKAAFHPEGVTHENALQALAAFERSLVSGSSRFDWFLRGKRQALSDDALAGLHLFRTDARCINCHNGPLLTDDKFHNLGLGFLGRAFEDVGRYKVTGDPADAGKFRTPSLRNVARTAPYMHNGLFDLEEALRLYNAGMRSDRIPVSDTRGLKPVKSPHLKTLNLNSQDLADLTAFLGTLSEPRRRVMAPELPE